VSEISNEALVAGISALVGGGAAFGVLRGKMSSYMKHSEHRAICHDKSDETNKKIDTLFDRLGQTSTKIDELSGYIRGKMES
jgi:hypothetical protein